MTNSCLISSQRVTFLTKELKGIYPHQSASQTFLLDRHLLVSDSFFIRVVVASSVYLSIQPPQLIGPSEGDDPHANDCWKWTNLLFVFHWRRVVI
jgi:hypothetical protein